MYYGAQSYGQPSYNAYGSNYDAGRRKSLGYDQNPSDYRRRSSSLDYEPSGAPRYSRRQSMADPFADDDERMSRQRLMEDLDYQIQEKKRLEEMRREKESYEERLLDQNIARQRKQMEEEYQREQALKMMKEEQRRKRYAAHQAYLASLEQQNRQSNQRHQSPPDSPEFSPPRSSEHELDPNSRYDAYDRTPVKGKGTYDLGSADKIGPRSKPPGFKPTKTLTPRPDKSRSSSNSSKPKPRSGDRMPDPSKALSPGSRASQSKPIAKKSASPDRTKLAPPKGKSPMVERKSKDNYVNNNNNAPSKMDMSMTDLPKRRKIPSSDDRFEFGLNLNQASKITLEVQRDNNPFFDSKPGRRRKTPDPRKGKNEGQSAPPSPQPQSPSNHLQASQSPPHSRTPSPRVSMDSEVQTSDASERKSERHRNEARDMAAQTMAPSIENSAQTFEEDFEPEKPPTPKPRPVPFDWKIKLDETTGDWRSKQEDDSKKEIETFEEQHKDLTSQLLAMKKGLKGEDPEDRTRSRSSDHQDSGWGEAGGRRRRHASADSPKSRSDAPPPDAENRRQGRTGDDRSDSPSKDDLIDLEGTDRTVLGAYLNKTGSRSSRKTGSGEDGQRTGGYTPSSGDKTRNGTPETDPDSGGRKTDSGGRTNSGNWDETPNFLRRKEPFNLDATDRTLLSNYVDRNKRQ